MSRAGVTATIRARAPEHFGPALRRIREARGLTQEQVAEAIGCSAPDVGRYERCTQHGPKREAIVRFARRVGLDPRETAILIAQAALDRGALDVDGPPCCCSRANTIGLLRREALDLRDELEAANRQIEVLKRKIGERGG